MAFIEAVVKATGNKQRVPEHWLDHPTIGAQFRLPPSASKAEKSATAATTEAKASSKKSTDS